MNQLRVAVTGVQTLMGSLKTIAIFFYPRHAKKGIECPTYLQQHPNVEQAIVHL